MNDEALRVLYDLSQVMELGDLVYDIREREGQGWEGPKVQAWSNACERMRKLLEGYEP
jgi:hypothetical protein